MGVSAFRIRWAISIELSEQSRQLGWSRLRKLGRWAMEHTEMCVSRLQDHIALDADICYLDTAHMGGLDEGPLILKFLHCSRRLLSGSFLILLTRCQEFDPNDYGCYHVKLVLATMVSRGCTDESNVWILRIQTEEQYTQNFGTVIDKARAQDKMDRKREQQRLKIS